MVVLIYTHALKITNCKCVESAKAASQNKKPLGSGQILVVTQHLQNRKGVAE
jgi:hypothetical protein